MVAIVFTILKALWIERQPKGTDKMIRIAGYISNGAMAFIKAECKILSIVVVSIAILLAFTIGTENSSHLVAVSFIMGA